MQKRGEIQVTKRYMSTLHAADPGKLDSRSGTPYKGIELLNFHKRYRELRPQNIGFATFSHLRF